MSDDAYTAEAPLEKLNKRKSRDNYDAKGMFDSRVSTGQAPSMNNLLSYSSKYGPDATRSRYQDEEDERKRSGDDGWESDEEY